MEKASEGTYIVVNSDDGSDVGDELDQPAVDTRTGKTHTWVFNDLTGMCVLE